MRYRSKILQREKMSEETREETVSELRAYKGANPNWITDIEMAQVVASYNNRLASMSPPAPVQGNYIHPVNLIELFPSHISLISLRTPKQHAQPGDYCVGFYKIDIISLNFVISKFK